jgi:hypothetical protein
MSARCVISSQSKEALTKAVNKYLFSTSWKITDDNKLYNTKLKKYADGYSVTNKNKRWQLNIKGEVTHK